MKFDQFLHALLPKDDKFFNYFENDVQNLLHSAKVFKDLMSPAMSREERAQKIKLIEELEFMCARQIEGAE